METTRLEQTMAAPEEVSADTVMASVISDLESVSSLKEKQRTALKAFIMEKMFSFFLQPASMRLS